MKLWGGRFETGPSEIFERFSNSLHFDKRLIEADVRGSQAFARTGNPNHKGIPKWTPFTLDRRTTMIWNNECRVADDPFREQRLARIAANI